jgi:hypothetical protein
MKTISTLQKMALFCALGLISLGLNAQSIITIDNNPGSTTTYQTIQDAIDNAADNDIIYVQPSPSSYGSAIITKPISIIGRSHSEPLKGVEMGTVSIRSSAITLKGIKFSSLGYSTSNTPQTAPFVGLTITECFFTSCTIGSSNSSAVAKLAINVDIRGSIFSSTVNMRGDIENVLLSNNIFNSNMTTFDTTSLVVANNIFRMVSFSSLNITNSSISGPFILSNNMFFVNSSSNKNVNLNSGPFNLSNNLTYNYGTGDLGFNATFGGSFNDTNTLLNTDPLFTDVNSGSTQSFAGNSSYNPVSRLADDLTLQAGSPALTGGVGASEIGLYNNGYNFEILGVPNGYPILDILTNDGAVPKNGNINVTINAIAK